MDVRSISGTPVVAPVQNPVTVVKHAPPVRVTKTADYEQAPWPGDTVEVGSLALKEALESPDDVKVAVHRRDDGMMLVTLYDSSSGQVIVQMPPERVVAALDAALKEHQAKRN